MIQIMKDMLDPTYFLTVVPLGTLYLAYYWRKDSKQIAEISNDDA